MTCERCAGLMLRDPDNDYSCFQCGAVKVVNIYRPPVVPASFKHTGRKRGPTRVTAVRAGR